MHRLPEPRAYCYNGSPTDFHRKDCLRFSLRTCRAAWLAALLCAWLAGCNRTSREATQEVGYASGAQVEFRNELGPASRVSGKLHSGERVAVIGRHSRWLEIRCSNGEVGWVQEASLVSQQIFDQFQELARQTEALPSQGSAVVRRTANLHLTPGRATQAFYQLAEDEHVEVVKHDVVARVAKSAAAASSAQGQPQEMPHEMSQEMEDWLLVRGSGGRTGWVLEGGVDMDPPLEVARYSEGLRIRAWFVLYQAQDEGQEHNWYLWATIHRLAGLPYDFDEIRVFVWDAHAHRYETSYRERHLMGHFPIETGMRQTPAGPSPTFRLHLENPNGQRYDESYYMAGYLVRSDHSAQP